MAQNYRKLKKLVLIKFEIIVNKADIKFVTAFSIERWRVCQTWYFCFKEAMIVSIKLRWFSNCFSKLFICDFSFIFLRFLVINFNNFFINISCDFLLIYPLSPKANPSSDSSNELATVESLRLPLVILRQLIHHDYLLLNATLIQKTNQQMCDHI